MSQWIRWTGITKEGIKRQGIIEAETKELAKKCLHQQGILVKSLNKKSFRDYFKKKIPPLELIKFFQQLAVLTKANISIAQSLGILSKNPSSKLIKEMIFSLKEDIEKGLPLATAFTKHNDNIQDTICQLIMAGERSGSLAPVLENIAKTQEKQQTLKQNLKKALTYPCLVFFVALLVTYGILSFIIPQFQNLFTSLNVDLPILTRILMSTANYFKQFGLFIFGGLALCFFILIISRRHNIRFATFLDKIILKSPFVGSILKKTAIARFSTTLNLCLSAGLPLIEALKTIVKINANRCFVNATKEMVLGVSNGQALHISMRNTGLFPPLVTELVAIGEETGEIEPMFAKIYCIFEKSLDDSVDKVSYLVEPLILLILGLLVGCLVIALYLPLFKLGSAL